MNLNIFNMQFSLGEILRNIKDGDMPAAEKALKQIIDTSPTIIHLTGEADYDMNTGVLYFIIDEHKTKKGPFCNVCFTNDSKIVPTRNYAGGFFCDVCKRGFGVTKSTYTITR